MVDAARSFASGAPAIGSREVAGSRTRLSSFEGIVPKGIDWRTLGECKEERAAE
jgi:phthalate 4,5-dioxygenase oxygenase subunit